jgi:hypothetical protein
MTTPAPDARSIERVREEHMASYGGKTLWMCVEGHRRPACDICAMLATYDALVRVAKAAMEMTLAYHPVGCTWDNCPCVGWKAAHAALPPGTLEADHA